MLSEAELHLRQLRMAAGRQRQIERGEYRQHLPTGLVRLEDGRVVKDPDLQVQRTLALVFARFAALGSCQKVLRRFRDEGLRLPRRQTSGPEAGVLLWKPPSEHVIDEILHNPAYAGAFVYGRHRRHPDSRPGQHAPRVNCPLEEWAVNPARCLSGVPQSGRSSWPIKPASTTTAIAIASGCAGPPATGRRCWPGSSSAGNAGGRGNANTRRTIGMSARAQGKERGAGLCLHLDGPSIDAVVVAAFFEALQPAELDLLDAVLGRAGGGSARGWRSSYADQVARAEYEARLAQRQYLAADPDNRLVAGELERRWELALRALAEAHEAAERFATAPTVPSSTRRCAHSYAISGDTCPHYGRAGSSRRRTRRSCSAA